MQAMREFAPAAAVEGDRMGLLRKENSLLTSHNEQLDKELARLQGELDAQMRRTLDTTQESSSLAARLQVKEVECESMADTCAAPHLRASCATRHSQPC
jgi:hypothetical protein